MAALPNLITVEQFLELPEGGEHTYELHHRSVVPATRPTARHTKLQRRMMRLLDTKLGSFGEVITELPYRPVPEFEVRAADVGVVLSSRWNSVDDDDILRGPPELVIEVKSPSNRQAQLQEVVALCLANGSIECWVVDPKQNTVTVVRREGAAIVYTTGDSIPLTSFGADELPVDDIFHTHA
jgi:Uma2 family endonuclease